MSYQVLARKWRPKNFEEVIGQEHVLRVLANALTQQKIHHAYLFAGTRGVGKTTIARILAKCLNCETGVTATPCCKCNSCLEIDQGNFMDLIEVDAASRTKVEDTRDLLENVQYLPVRGRFKIYLIDEIHMLSGHSFNALLKTLEEPPAHVKFLLATTDPQKLPITVLSRCLQFNLKALTPELLQKQIQYVLQQEQIKHEDDATYQLALAASGSVRDALSLLDQAVAFGQGKIIKSDVDIMLGTIDITHIFALIEALLTKNANSLLDTISNLAELAADFNNVLDGLLEIFQNIATVQIAPTAKPSSWQNLDKIIELASKFTPEEVQLYYQIGLIGKRDLPLAPSLRLGFEMIMLRMFAFRPQNETAPISLDTKKPQITKNTQLPKPPSSPTTKEEFINILQQLKVTGPTKMLLHHCIIKKITPDEIELLLDPNQAPLLNKKHEERINKAFSEHFKRPTITKLTLGSIGMDTIANNTKQEATRKQKEAAITIQKDKKIQNFMEKFDAKIISDPESFE